MGNMGAEEANIPPATLPTPMPATTPPTIPEWKSKCQQWTSLPRITTATNQIKIRSTAESKSASGLHGWGSSQRGAEADRSGSHTTKIPLHYARRQPIRTSTVGARIGLAYTACGPLLYPFLSSAFRNEIVFVEGEHVLPVDVSYVQ